MVDASRRQNSPQFSGCGVHLVTPKSKTDKIYCVKIVLRVISETNISCFLGVLCFPNFTVIQKGSQRVAGTAGNQWCWEISLVNSNIFPFNAGNRAR